MRRLGLAVVGVSLWAGPVWAQTPEAVSIVEEIAVVEAEGAVGVTLSVSAQTLGVPAVLHAVHGRADSPLAALTVENRAQAALTHLALAITWTPPTTAPRRRVVVVPVSVHAGATVRVPLEALDTLARLVGQFGAIEVALVGARTADDARYRGDPGPLWSTGQTVLACADGQWQAHLKDTEQADQTTGRLVRCASDGQWVALDGSQEREQ